MKILAGVIVAPAATRPFIHRSARFGSFHVDFRSHELFKDDAKVHLQDHSFQILGLLLERPGEVVSREELGERLWHSHTFVDFDQGLNTAIMRLRHALEDVADTPRFIETLPRHGYRFIAPVSFADERSDPPQLLSSPPQIAEGLSHDSLPQNFPSVESPQRTRRRLLRPAGMLVLSTALVVPLLLIYGRGGFRAMFHQRAPAADVPTLAVLPFDSLSNDADQNFLAESMTEQLITELGQGGKLRVLSRGTVMRYAGKHIPLETVASELHADAIFEGSITQSSGRIRVTANLYQVATRRHLWAETYEGGVGDRQSPEREIAGDIARNVQANLIPQ